MAFACAVHSKMKHAFELATQKGAEPIANSEMSPELQVLSIQLHYMLVMMQTDQALEKVRSSPGGVGLEVWCWLVWQSELCVVTNETS